ncbi:hypothetical protein GCM10007857_88750 [Bradyrhizobium iriomotense]|uniref:Uncharacterized protein n=1 Tax=Bradyrhizobium iriomotense TaxID=441950 RepID=A0ABQ6BGU0_9BRAD|nr:hypothetical protein GCM10007857_88750 [Bradyrhizobium iriomotense]
MLIATITFGVLHGAGNADRDIEFGAHDLASLADPLVVGRIAGIHRRTRGTHAGAQLVGERLDIW